MDLYQSRLVQHLDKRLNTEILDCSLALGTKTAEDYSDYRYRVGIITGIRLALKLAAEVEADMGREEGSAAMPVSKSAINGRYS